MVQKYIHVIRKTKRTAKKSHKKTPPIGRVIWKSTVTCLLLRFAKPQYKQVCLIRRKPSQNFQWQI
jgi:hypothetical protein